MDRQCSSCGGFCKKSGCERENVKPEPEPVAWITRWNEPNDAGVELDWVKQERGPSSKHTPLYITQIKKDAHVIDKSMAKHIATQLGWEPKKEWVGLTAADLMELVAFTHMTMENALSVEARLKDKNNG